jgi:ATP-dependent DNA ligase I
VLLNEIALVSAQVARVPGRRAKIDLIAGLLRHAAPEEVPVAVAFLSGELRQRQIGVGYAALGDLLGFRGETAGAVAGTPTEAVAGTPAGTIAGTPSEAVAVTASPAAEPTVTIAEADETFAAIGRVSGAGAQAERRRLLAGLLQRATEEERSFLVQLLAGDLRQGALEGVMIEAVAQAAGVPAPEVRRALMLGGSLPAVARAALCGFADPLGTSVPPGTAAGPADALSALRSFTLRVGRPLRPMLAAAAPTVAAALQKVSPAAIEWKIDGIRVQVHKDGQGVAVFTRTLDDITARVPEIAEAVLALPAASAVLDGEAVALYPDGRPRPFQVTASRAGTRTEVESRRGDVPLTPFFFDLLHLDGTDLIDAPAEERFAALARLLPAGLVIPRTVTADLATAEELFADAVAHGHEGVVLKSLGSPYAAGRRGSEWIKVKPRHTLDLVVLAAEWGHGRRRGWLSNLHLGARDPATGDLVMLGKTFKGLTDQMLAWQTGRLLELADPGPGRPPAGAGAADAEAADARTTDVEAAGTGAADAEAAGTEAAGTEAAGTEAPDAEATDAGTASTGATDAGTAGTGATGAGAADAGTAGHVVRVRPELVVEIAFDGIQASRRYPGGIALRFARVIRYRPDKRAADADTIDAVRAVAPAGPRG